MPTDSFTMELPEGARMRAPNGFVLTLPRGRGVKIGKDVQIFIDSVKNGKAKMRIWTTRDEDIQCFGGPMEGNALDSRAG